MTTRVAIKGVLAWSTIGQMGFMLVQCGLGAWHMALMHLLAHSLYKAHTFLSAGSVVQQWRAAHLVHNARASLWHLLAGAALAVYITGSDRSDAAREETDHLAWCEARLKELGARPSVLNPLWYAGSFGIGTLAALLGDRASLGFVAETERQVEGHLKSHLERLPSDDSRSRAIVEAMCHDEVGHGREAQSAGAASLPGPVRELMRRTARIMTHTSYRL